MTNSATEGPGLSRPLVGKITGPSKVPNLKELRPSSFRILFAFDPKREVILLVGGDKRMAGWTAWYTDAIKVAERLNDEWLDGL